jgi:predicted nuclease with TOPRIM domain
MEDGDIVDVHMEQLGGGGPPREKLQDWVEVESTLSLLQQVCNEKWMIRVDYQKACEEIQEVREENSRLMATYDRLKRELAALKTNNRALARDNNVYKVSLMLTGSTELC